MAKDKHKTAFTLIELLIAVTIIFIFGGLSFAYYNNFTQEQKLKNEAKKFVDVLELAKKKASAGDSSNKTCNNFNGYQITISNNNSYSLYICCNNNCSTEINTYSLGNNAEFTTLTPMSFRFLPLSAGVQSSSSFPLNICIINTKINKYNKIIINQSGVIKLEENLTTTCS